VLLPHATTHAEPGLRATTTTIIIIIIIIITTNQRVKEVPPSTHEQKTQRGPALHVTTTSARQRGSALGFLTSQHALRGSLTDGPVISWYIVDLLNDPDSTTTCPPPTTSFCA